MSIMRKGNAEDLTDDEVAFLRSDRTPESIRQFVARQHEHVGVRASAFRKVAAAARAEREALIEVAILNATRAKAGVITERIPPPLARESDLSAEVDRLRGELLQLKAGPAMAVHGD